MTHRRPRGFTLVELLVVVTIVGMLLAILMPAFGMVWKAAKLSQCSQNLYRISQAYAVRGADSRLDPDRVRPLRVGSWKTMLLPYLENDSSVLVCPEANMEVGQPEEGYDDPYNPAGPGVSDGGWSGGSGGSTQPVPTGSVSTEDLKVEVWLRPGAPFRGVTENNLIYVMDCEPGQWARRYNPGEETIRGGKPSGRFVPQDCTYELGFEDSWNTTWDDLYLRFIEKPDGSLEIIYVEENTGGNCYNLVNITTGEQLLVGMGDGNAAHGWPKLPYGASVTIKPEQQTQEAPVISDDRNPVFSGGGGGSTGAGITAGTYGMNSLADKVEGLGSHVILCLDYKKTVARGPTTPLPDLWTNIGWQTADGLPIFARHDGRINVLFSDGSVELVSPAEIDPAGPASVRRLWDPTRGR